MSLLRRNGKPERVVELRHQAKQVAGQSGDALKEFADQAGSAARDFAKQTKGAAKDLVVAIERATQGLEPQRKRGSRKLLLAATVFAIGAVLVAIDKFRMSKSRPLDPVWEPSQAAQPTDTRL